VDDDTPDRDGNVTTPIRFYDAETLLNLTDPADLQNPQTPLYSLLTFTNDAGSTRRTRFVPGKWDNGQTPEGLLTSVNHKTGELNYETDIPDIPILTTPAPDPPTSSFDAPRARTVYWTLDGWAQQIAVAARSYLPYISEPHAREEWREYYWQGNQAAKAVNVARNARGVLYFPPSESGKSVLVTFEYVDDDGNYQRQSSVVTISDKFDGFETPTSPGDLRNAWGDKGAQARRGELREPDGDFYDVRAILSVQGLSVQSRTAWIENNARYTQAEAVGYRKLD
jgi:hypothetical protein